MAVFEAKVKDASSNIPATFRIDVLVPSDGNKLIGGVVKTGEMPKVSG
jgi:hypothetical protein